MFGTGLLRKATKVVVYTAIPVAGPLKAATMGTRNTRLNLKEQQKQTALMEQMAQGQGSVASPPSSGSEVLVTPDNKWISFDGGAHFAPYGSPPPVAAASPATPATTPPKTADQLRAEQLHAKSRMMLTGSEWRWLRKYEKRTAADTFPSPPARA
jgi:hypothetical protein